MLSGTKVTLGSLRAEDSNKLFEWINNADLVRLNAPFKPVHFEAHKEWFDSIAKDPNRACFAIREKEGDRLIGYAQLINIHPVHRSAELTIRIGDKAFHSKGYGTDAVRTLVEFAWRDLNLHRVFLHVFADNRRAVRAYEKAGFRVEGHLREAAFIDGGWCDVLVMGLLQHEA